MGARTTSYLTDLEHRNACVGLAGNNLELAGNGKPELQVTAIHVFFYKHQLWPILSCFDANICVNFYPA